MPATLYVIATPIGNLEDITLRALRILKEVDLIAAEDTRITRKLLSHYGIHTPLTSYHQHSRGEKAQDIVGRLQAGQSVALVSDAGLPGVSDPGADLIGLAIEAGIPVVPVPGPNAALSALVVSGLPSGRFAFEGFPPRGKTDRRAFFDALRGESRTLILYESPGRLLSTLEDLYAVLGDRPIAVAREMTKVFEEVLRGRVSEAIAQFQARRPRGEFTLVIGPPDHRSDAPREETVDVKELLQAAMEAGLSPRDAVIDVAGRLHLPKRKVYRTLLEIRI